MDLQELYQPKDLSRLGTFWHAFQQVYLDLYGSRLATIAAMAGHAPAAGCMVALACDYRIMTSNPKRASIGLNESQLGIVAPPWLGQMYIDTIGHRRAEWALSLGTLFLPTQALEIGLVDQLVSDDDDVVPVAKEQAAQWIRIPSQARVATKQLTRQRQMDHLMATRDADTEHFCTFVTQDKVKKTLGIYLERLAKKKK